MKVSMAMFYSIVLCIFRLTEIPVFSVLHVMETWRKYWTI